MFIRRTTYNRLVARADAYAGAYVAARRADRRKAVPAAARRERLAAACLRYRAELAEQRAQHAAALARQQRRADQLQQQLDDVLGLNSSDVQAGVRWQQRRQDRPRPYVEAGQ
ncbi:hypothetical protein J7F03_20590 [Streptomyces sp. ISL-43]|uniref:hypothetical protein n=1 Tax=Streptomyces sp. ISL-43 TaxID=2819183 RepID=UPI001BE557EE|nr:hypothetical protein [Streptomyces sp. ISL-43]MBT2449442.1 hypothetical protein [Streptomyces sp. ISL-43]